MNRIVLALAIGLSCQLHAMEITHSKNEIPSLKDLCISTVAKFADDANWPSQQEILPDELQEAINEHISLKKETTCHIARFLRNKVFRASVKEIELQNIDEYKINDTATAQHQKMMLYVAKDKKVHVQTNKEKFILLDNASDVFISENPLLIWTFYKHHGTAHCYDQYGNHLHLFDTPASYHDGELVINDHTFKIIRSLFHNRQHKVWDLIRFQQLVKYFYQLPITDLRQIKANTNDPDTLEKFMNNLFSKFRKKYNAMQRKETRKMVKEQIEIPRKKQKM